MLKFNLKGKFECPKSTVLQSVERIKHIACPDVKLQKQICLVWLTKKQNIVNQYMSEDSSMLECDRVLLCK